MKAVGLYARVSTKDQSPEMQLSDLRKYAEARGWTVSGEYVDHGVSGSKERRPALDRLMDDARKRKIDGVLCWRFDRFARSTSHLLKALEEFKSLGVGFVSFQENLDTNSPLGTAMFSIISAISQLERDIIRERIHGGLRRAKEKGHVAGRKRNAVDEAELKRKRSEGVSFRDLAEYFRVSVGTIFRLVGKPEAVIQ